MPDPIALGQPTFGPEELAAVAAVLDRGGSPGKGRSRARSKPASPRMCGTAGALALNNCTAALHLAVDCLGAGAGDEVIVADYTFPATGHAVRYTGREAGLRRRAARHLDDRSRRRRGRDHARAPSA